MLNKIRVKEILEREFRIAITGNVIPDPAGTVANDAAVAARRVFREQILKMFEVSLLPSRIDANERRGTFGLIMTATAFHDSPQSIRRGIAAELAQNIAEDIKLGSTDPFSKMITRAIIKVDINFTFEEEVSAKVP